MTQMLSATPASLSPTIKELLPSAAAIFWWSGTHKAGSSRPHFSVADDEDKGHDSDEDNRVDELLYEGVGGGLKGGTRSRSAPISSCTFDGRGSGHRVPGEWQREDGQRETRCTTWLSASPRQGCRGWNQWLGEPSPTPPRLQRQDPCGGGNQVDKYEECVGDKSL
jgi:hypothetical protein